LARAGEVVADIVGCPGEFPSFGPDQRAKWALEEFELVAVD
jgi:hypothetical protein